MSGVFGICLGCRVFGVLMRFGVVPDSVCADGEDIWARRSSRAAA